MSEKLRILIVDDDRRMANTLLDIFKVKGYLAEAAYSGAEALEKVEEGHFDSVLTDLKMPEMNGVDLYRAINMVIVDDDPQFCKTLGDILRARGFAVTEVTYPAGLANKLGPDGQVVVLDMKFNSTSGLAILKEIREQYPQVPVILVTGYREEMAQAIEASR